MIRPDYRDFRRGSTILIHSAKGSTWEDHKYIKRIDGTYYYPDSYEGGRHLDNSDESEEVRDESSFNLTSDEIDTLAKEVIRGNFANGEERKEALGEHYQEIQDRVNELMLSSSGTTKVSEASEETIETGTEAVKKAVSTTASSMNLDEVYSVYTKKK